MGNSAYERKPPQAEPPLHRRNCLRCGAGFMSEGAHNRICRTCKTTATWRDGAVMAAFDSGYPGGRVPLRRGKS